MNLRTHFVRISVAAAVVGAFVGLGEVPAFAATPTVTINDVTVNEGDGGLTPATFTLTLSEPAGPAGASVRATTANITATAPADYQPRSGVLVSFAPGQTTQTFTVQVVGDNVDEPTETFEVVLGRPVNVVIADFHGVATIVDDERSGRFSCRASALRLGSIETAVANDQNVPCADDDEAVLTANLSALLGSINVRSSTLRAVTNQTPDDLESSPPALSDNGVAQATVETATVETAGLIITTTDVRSTATVQCVAGPNGMVPGLSSSSSIAQLTINGLAVDVNSSGSIPLPLGLGTIDINRTVTTPTSVTQQAIRINLLGIQIVISEARANFTGNPCAA